MIGIRSENNWHEPTIDALIQAVTSAVEQTQKEQKSISAQGSSIKLHVPDAGTEPRLNIPNLTDRDVAAIDAIAAYIGVSATQRIRLEAVINFFREQFGYPAINAEPAAIGWRRWAWVDSENRLSIMKPNATREEVAELGEPDERLIRVHIMEVAQPFRAQGEVDASTRA